MKTPRTIEGFRQDLRLAMQRSGYIQQDIARLCGVSQGAISNLLSGKRGISGSSLLKLWDFVYPTDGSTTSLTSTPGQADEGGQKSRTAVVNGEHSISPAAGAGESAPVSSARESS